LEADGRKFLGDSQKGRGKVLGELKGKIGLKLTVKVSDIY
jgi:hypothetical protein